MAKISTYDNASPVSLTDKVIGTSVGGSPSDATKNFLLSDILALFEGSITLSDVLTAGNTATNNIVLTGNITCTQLTTTANVNAVNVVASGNVNAVNITAISNLACSGLSVSGFVTSNLNVSADVIANNVTSGGLVDTSNLRVTGAIDGQSNARGSINIALLPAFADNVAAAAGGLIAGDVYRTDGTGATPPFTTAGLLMIL